MFNEYDNDNNYMKEDKILNNSYNSGDIEYESFGKTMKIHDKVAGQYKNTISENMIEQRTLDILDDKIYKIFIESPFYEKYKNPKRVDKGDMVKMYYYFKDRLVKEVAFTSIQIFIGFAEFFQINYEQLYNEIGVLDKENVLKELNENLGLEKKIKTKKLF